MILTFWYWVRTRDILFDALEYQQRYREILFALGDACLTSLSQCALKLNVQHMDKITRVYETLKVLYLLQVCVALLHHHPHL